MDLQVAVRAKTRLTHVKADEGRASRCCGGWQPQREDPRCVRVRQISVDSRRRGWPRLRRLIRGRFGLRSLLRKLPLPLLFVPLLLRYFPAPLFILIIWRWQSGILW